MSVGTPSVDALQLWILTSQVEGHWPFDVVTAPNAGHIMNLRFPEVDRSQVTVALQGLFDAGFLLATRRAKPVRWQGRGELERWIASNSRYPDEIRIGLTPAGGLLWERECKADWSRYLNSRGSRGVEVNGEFFFPFTHFEGPTLTRLTVYAMHHEVPGQDFRQRTRVRQLRPWVATYWKTLPSGYRISCHYRYGKRDADWMAMRPNRNSREFVRWYQDPA